MGQQVRNLTGQQQRQLARAQTAGNEQQYLAKHQGVAAHQQKVGAMPGTPAAAPAGAPATGASGGKSAQPAAATPPPSTGNPPAGAGGGKAKPPPTTSDILNKQYGSDASQKFQQNWYGDNPLSTAQAAATRATDQALAGVRNRYAQSGFGNSSREALSEGQAIGDVNTNLGAQLAQLGTQTRGSDMDRLANMFAQSGAQDLQSKQLALTANQQLMNAGTGVTGIGTSEQSIPNADLITTILTNMSQQPTQSQGAQKQPRK
jgi:hypothetical protein